MAELVQLIKELIAMDASIYEIAFAGAVLIFVWRLPEIISAISDHKQKAKR